MTQTRRGTRGRSTGRAIVQRPAGDDGRATGEVEAAVRRDLDGLAVRDQGLAQSGLAASALALARGIDDPRSSLTSKSMAARALREALDRLLELAPPEETSDRIDELGGRAARKLGRTAA